MNRNAFSVLFATVAVSAGVLLIGCSGESRTVALQPGAYIKKISDSRAQLVVVGKDQKHTVIDGDFKVTSPVSPSVGRLTVSSLGASYEVTTPACGAIHFIESKGGVICTTCMSIQSSPASYSNCPVAQVGAPTQWTPLGF